MGNWRRVQIVGTCDRGDVLALRDALNYGNDFDKFHCLCNGGMCGLPNWAGENINAVGNLAERGYTPQDVADQLLKLITVAPSLNVKVHCGADYEGEKCINTVVASRTPMAAVLEPEIAVIPEAPVSQLHDNMMAQLYGRR